MKILVDYRPALRARTGVGEYMHELARAYAVAHPDDRVGVFTSSWKDRPVPSTAAQLGATVIDRRVPVNLLNYLWHRRGWPPVEALAGRWDVVHAAHPLLIPARRAAQVVTVHDLFFLLPDARTHAEIRRDYAELAAPHAQRADAVVTPSHYTRQLVIEQLGVPADRVYACPFGAPQWQRLGRRVDVPRDGYLLFVGTLVARKNVGVLLDAYAQLVARLPDAPRLLLAGGATPDAAGWLARMSAPPLAGRVEHIGYVPEEDREQLYAGARALIMPSLDEGFGVPALEAMAAGVPVIASNRGSLPEVVGAAGTLLDPSEPAAFAEAMWRVVTDNAWAAAQAGAGLERARSFTWDSTAARLQQAYRDAVARREARG